MGLFFPSFETICRALKLKPATLLNSSEVTVPTSLFLGLLSQALNGVEINSELYGRQNPDVDKAIGMGNAAELKRHFCTAGYFELRAFPISGFDEAYYEERYPDVKSAIKAKLLEGALSHFQNDGLRELRCPSKASEPDHQGWCDILSRASQRR